MAVREMEAFADEAAARWARGWRWRAWRSVAWLGLVAATPHRAETFAAACFAIDTLKERIPIWNREVATDGAYRVDDHA